MASSLVPIEPAERFIATYRPTLDDFVAMMDDYWALTPSRVRRVYFWKALTIGAALVSAGLAWRSGNAAIAACAVLLLCWPLVVPKINKVAYARVFARQRLGECDVTITLDDDALAAVSMLSEQRFPWSVIERISVTQTHAFFWVHAYLAVIMPVAAFRDRPTFDRAIDFARSKVQSKSIEL